MLIDAVLLEDQHTLQSDVTVVGAGPAGIVVALELANAGYDVILVESGGTKFSKFSQELGETPHFDPNVHAPMSRCTARQIGGTSAIWGGRCVPYDPLDFDFRPYITDARWPVSYPEIAQYYQRACDWLCCGDAEFDVRNIPEITKKSLVPGFAEGDVLTSSLERWSLPTNFGREYRRVLESSTRVRVVHGLTCTEIESDATGKRVTRLIAKASGGNCIPLKSRAYVLACGGLESTRLLLASDRKHRGGIGNHSNKLGRFYMGHISGRIANIHFNTPPKQTIYGFDRDSKGIYLRRRIAFAREFHHDKQLPNIVGWLVNPDIHDQRHGSGVLSLAYLMLSSPLLGKKLASEAIRVSACGGLAKRIVWPHILNVIRDIPRTAEFIADFGIKRFFPRRKIPAFFIRSRSNVYPLHYHGEQIPNWESLVSLTEDQDALGLRKLKIELRYTERDIDGVTRAHQYWDEHLQRTGIGHLEYTALDPHASAWAQTGDGFHQIGTTRMSDHPDDGVVDMNCCIHGFSDLFIASSSLFVTSGQANSTFTILAFALRLADHMKTVISNGRGTSISVSPGKLPAGGPSNDESTFAWN